MKVYVVLYCYQNREVEGRQIADPYGLKEFHMVPFNLMLPKPSDCGRLVSAPTHSESLNSLAFTGIYEYFYD